MEEDPQYTMMILRWNKLRLRCYFLEFLRWHPIPGARPAGRPSGVRGVHALGGYDR